MYERPFHQLRARIPIVLVLGFGAVLTGCETIQSIERHGLAASAFHTAYCEADADTRDQIDLMVVFEDGSAKLDVHCEPHRAEDEEFHPPRLQ